MTLITWSIVLKVILLGKQILKNKINELNEIKKVEIKGKRHIESQKKLLSLFDDLLKAIFNKTVNENSSSNTKNESKSESDHESDNETDNEW